MSTQIRNSGGGGGRNKNKSNHTGGGGGGGGDANPASQSTTNSKKTDATKTEKEKVHPKPTAEQLRIAQITNSNASEDPQMREKVATLIEMTQRSEEEVCCALNECDNNLERAVVFLLETLPVGAFETSSKKKKNKAANAAQEVSGADGEWANDSNANTDKREKSRNRASNRGGRGGTDSRGWRGREARENERNLRETRGGGGSGGGGGDRDRDRDREDRNNDNYRGPRRDGRSSGRGGGYAGRGGRGGGRMGGGRGSRGDRGYGSRHNANEEHQEVELWDNTIAQNAEKQQHQQQQDDAWGDWDNEEYVGSLKDSKVFTTSNLNNQTAASVLSGSGGGAGVVINNTNELSAPPGLEHHLGNSVLGGTASASQQQGSHLNALVGNASGNGSLLGENVDGSTSAATGVQTGSVVGGVQSSTSIMQYSAAVSSNQIPQQTQQQSSSNAGVTTGATQTQSYSSSGVDTFTNAATAAANLVQQVQQQQQQAQLKSSATLSAEQSQYFNSLASQSGGPPGTVQQQQQQPMATYAQSAAAVNYPQTFANVFGTGATTDQTQQQPQVRRARAKLPPPSKIPATAVEMPGDSLNTVGYLDVQFGGLDFGADESFEGLSEKFTAAVNIDGQQQVQQEVEVSNDYQNKPSVQQQGSLSSGLQNAQITDSLTSASYTQRGAPQPQQTQVASAASAASTLDQLKNDPYNQTNSASAAAFQNPYQTTTVTKSAANSYQHVATAAGQGYNSAGYANVQSSVTANSYQPQAYSVYQQNSVNSYQQQHQQQQQTSSQSIATNVVAAGNNGGVVTQSGGVSGSTTQNIPVGSNNSANANTNTGYLSSGYSTQPSAYQSSQSVYGNTGLSNNTGYAGSSSTSTSQYSNFSTNAKLKETSTSSSTTHYDSISSSNSGGSNSSTSVNSSKFTNANVNSAGVVTNNNTSSVGVSNSVNNSNGTTNATVSSVVAGSQTNNGNAVSATVVAASGVSASSNKNSNTGSSSSSGAISGSSGAGASGAGAGGMVPTNIQMVSQYIQTGLPYYQQPVYSYEDLQMMQQRVQHVPGYYDLNYTPTSLNTGRDNLGSVAYSTMTDGRFTRTDNNSSPVSNVSSTMSQQAGSSAPMLNVPYAAYFYGGNVMPGSFQYGTPAIYPQQIPAANTPSGGQFPKPSYNTGYNSTSYDTLSQASQDYTKGAYQSNVNQQTKSQNVTNQAQAGTGSDITSTMYGKGHVALNKVNSYEKQNFHSGTPPPFNMANTQTAGGTSAQPYGMYLQMPAAGHHNMIHQPMHQMDGRIHSSSRRDSNSTGQRQQTSSQSKSANKQGYTPSYWTGQN